MTLYKCRCTCVCRSTHHEICSLWGLRGGRLTCGTSPPAQPVLPTSHPLQDFGHRRLPLAAHPKATSQVRCGCASAPNPGRKWQGFIGRGEWGRVALASPPSNPDLPWQQAYSERSSSRLTVCCLIYSGVCSWLDGYPLTTPKGHTKVAVWHILAPLQHTPQIRCHRPRAATPVCSLPSCSRGRCNQQVHQGPAAQALHKPAGTRGHCHARGAPDITDRFL